MPDLSKQSNNPTRYIHDNKDELSALAQQDPSAALNKFVEACRPMVGKGLSPTNFKKLVMRGQKALQNRNPEFSIQKFFWDYLLGGIDPGYKVSSVSRFESVDQLANLISEDRNIGPRSWPIVIQKLQKEFEGSGFTIKETRLSRANLFKLEVIAEHVASGSKLSLQARQFLKNLVAARSRDTVESELSDIVWDMIPESVDIATKSRRVGRVVNHILG